MPWWIISDTEDEISSELSSKDCSDSEESSDDSPPPWGRADAEGQWCDGHGFVPTVYNFDGTNSGITNECNLTDETLYTDYFELFFNKSVMDTLVTHSNSFFSYKGGYEVIMLVQGNLVGKAHALQKCLSSWPMWCWWHKWSCIRSVITGQQTC